MGQCWGGLTRRLRPSGGGGDEGCLIEMGSGEHVDCPAYEPAARPFCSLHTGSRTPSVLSARWLSTNSRQPTKGGYQRFPQPLPSQPGSLTSLDLEWDSQDCFKGLPAVEALGRSKAAPRPRSPSPVPAPRPQPAASLTLDNRNCTVLYRAAPQSRASSQTSLVWDGQTETEVHPEDEAGQQLDLETECLLHQIEELTSTALRETSHWSRPLHQGPGQAPGQDPGPTRPGALTGPAGPLVAVIQSQADRWEEPSATTPMSISTSSCESTTSRNPPPL